METDFHFNLKDLPPHKFIKIKAVFHYIDLWQGESVSVTLNPDSHNQGSPNYIYIYILPSHLVFSLNLFKAKHNPLKYHFIHLLNHRFPEFNPSDLLNFQR